MFILTHDEKWKNVNLNNMILIFIYHIPKIEKDSNIQCSKRDVTFSEATLAADVDILNVSTCLSVLSLLELHHYKQLAKCTEVYIAAFSLSTQYWVINSPVLEDDLSCDTCVQLYTRQTLTQWYISTLTDIESYPCLLWID